MQNKDVLIATGIVTTSLEHNYKGNVLYLHVLDNCANIHCTQLVVQIIWVFIWVFMQLETAHGCCAVYLGLTPIKLAIPMLMCISALHRN